MIDEALFRRLFADVASVGQAVDGWTRPPWTSELRAAEAVVTAAGAAIGLVAEHDAAGNLWLLAPDAPPDGLVGTGSHLDTVPAGGAFDGALGVVSGLVAVAALRAAEVAGRERLAGRLVRDEEGWRFATPLYGSRVLTGVYGRDILDRTDRDGVRLGDVTPPDPFAARDVHRRLAAFLEVHVEQGRILEPAGAAVGVATALAARSRFGWTIDGLANHAGTTPMTERRDALVAAARLVLDADAVAREVGGLATVGRLAVEPGGSNVIPGRVTGSLDVRGPDPATRDAIMTRLRATHVDVAFDRQADDPGVAFDPALRRVLHEAAAAVGVPVRDLSSGAGHDAGVLQAAGVPAAMLFVRSPDGVSHDPREHATEADCLAGCRVLAEALRRTLI
jgi:N-carbamoyl-L-amino-acid hydrolase